MVKNCGTVKNNLPKAREHQQKMTCHAQQILAVKWGSRVNPLIKENL